MIRLTRYFPIKEYKYGLPIYHRIFKMQHHLLFKDINPFNSVLNLLLTVESVPLNEQKSLLKAYFSLRWISRRKEKTLYV